MFFLLTGPLAIATNKWTRNAITQEAKQKAEDIRFRHRTHGGLKIHRIIGK